MLRALRPLCRQPLQLQPSFICRSLSSAAMASQSPPNTPMENAIRDKIQTSLEPTVLTIRNDSHLHAHHAPMRGVTSRETHFHVTVVAAAFEGKNQPARHRMVYGLLKDEMAQEGGIHALQLKTRTVQEEERDKEKGKEKEKGGDGV